MFFFAKKMKKIKPMPPTRECLRVGHLDRCVSRKMVASSCDRKIYSNMNVRCTFRRISGVGVPGMAFSAMGKKLRGRLRQFRRFCRIDYDGNYSLRIYLASFEKMLLLVILFVFKSQRSKEAILHN